MWQILYPHVRLCSQLIQCILPTEEWGRVRQPDTIKHVARHWSFISIYFDWCPLLNPVCGWVPWMAAGLWWIPHPCWSFDGMWVSTSPSSRHPATDMIKQETAIKTHLNDGPMISNRDCDGQSSDPTYYSIETPCWDNHEHILRAETHCKATSATVYGDWDSVWNVRY